MDIAFLAGFLILSRCLLAYKVVNRCPHSDAETWTSRGEEVCNTSVGHRYHCFQSINESFVEMCITPTGFKSRECPYFNPSSSSKFKYRKCFMRYGRCPPGGFYPSYNLYKYTACLHSQTAVEYSSRDYNEEITRLTIADRIQKTTRIFSNITATAEQKIHDVTTLKKLFENQKAQEILGIFESGMLKGVLAFTGGMLIAFACFVTYVIRRKKQMDLRMTYSNAVAFKDNTENMYDDITEAPLEIPNINTLSLEQSAYLEPHAGLHCHIDTSSHRSDVSEKEKTDMQLCDAEIEKTTKTTEETEVEDTAPSLQGFL